MFDTYEFFIRLSWFQKIEFCLRYKSREYFQSLLRQRYDQLTLKVLCVHTNLYNIWTAHYKINQQNRPLLNILIIGQCCTHHVQKNCPKRMALNIWIKIELIF
jgi:hypothetical protein